jgi:hydroxyethylthiazole kinase-like uncharacterized protein yjeF
MERIDALPPLPPRPRDAHKGTFGHVLIVAGSPGMAGAAVLSCRGALRSGSGLVTAATPASLSPIVAGAVSEATGILLPEGPSGSDPAALRAALHPLGQGRFQAVGIGPGLGTDARARAVLEAVLELVRCPLVLDADALNLIAAGVKVPLRDASQRVWTPHPGELGRLTGEKPRTEEERIAAASRAAEKLGGIVVLKGHRTIVLEKGRYRVNATGNPGMATGGTGDVLTGIITSLLGQGIAPFEAASLGVHLHGRAGDIAAETFGEASLIAGDIAAALPAAFKEHASRQA